VKLRLMRMGKTKQPTYRLVAADSRSPRDGRFIEVIGSYAPRQAENKVVLRADRVERWLKEGAQPTDRVKRILVQQGLVTARAVLEYLARQIVDEPEAVGVVTSGGDGQAVRLRLEVAPDDVGRVIGRRGRTAQAIRAVTRAAAARDGEEVFVDIAD